MFEESFNCLKQIKDDLQEINEFKERMVDRIKRDFKDSKLNKEILFKKLLEAYKRKYNETCSLALEKDRLKFPPGFEKKYIYNKWSER